MNSGLSLEYKAAASMPPPRYLMDMPCEVRGKEATEALPSHLATCE